MKLIERNILIIGYFMFFIFSCSGKDPIVPKTEEPDPEEEPISTSTFYKGTTMAFIEHQETHGNVVFKENGVAKDPYVSIYDHGGNISRSVVSFPPYKNMYTDGYPDADYSSPENVKTNLRRAQDAKLKTLLTISYQSVALNPEQKKNAHVAPLIWQPIANDVSKLKDSVYNYTYNLLEDYITSGIVPEIVAIGNETNWRILEPNLTEDELPAYSSTRVVSLLNEGSKAVRDLNDAYSLDIKIAIHLFGASNLVWWMGEHVTKGLDFDIMSLSHYHAWHSLGNFDSWTEVVKWVKTTYKKDFLIMETAQLFRSGGNDNHVDILGLDNIPLGYVNPPTTTTQRLYIRDFAQEISDAGGLGLIYWGGEWVGSNTLIYADQYGAGSSWENKAFWDFDHNLHDGINWMQDVKSKE